MPLPADHNLVAAVRLGHHHLAELVKVHRAAPVLVQLLDNSLKLLVGEGREQLGDQAPQGLGGDESLTLLAK